MPKWVEDHEKSTLLQAIKIINYRMKNKNNDSDNLKPEDILALEGSPARRENTRVRELKIDTVIANVKNKK